MASCSKLACELKIEAMNGNNRALIKSPANCEWVYRLGVELERIQAQEDDYK